MGLEKYGLLLTKINSVATRTCWGNLCYFFTCGVQSIILVRVVVCTLLLVLIFAEVSH